MENIQNDTALWELIRRGDHAAFDRLYHQYVSPIFASVYKHIQNRTDAEDITQEVFLECWEKRAGIIIHYSVFNYLYSMARYKTLRYIKINNSRPESLDLFGELLEARLPVPANVEDYPESALLHIESSISEQIAVLPEQMKKVYALHTESGMSISEIADYLQISPNTVKNHLFKVRKRLRQFVSRMASIFFIFF